MSRSLPQELKTQKSNSLPDDLRAIAEELIADKFDIREEVVEKKSPDPFHIFDDISDQPFMGRGWSERQRGYEDEICVEVRPWDHLRYAQLRIRVPNFRSLAEAMHRFDIENIHREREFLMNPDFIRAFVRQPEFAQYGKVRDRSMPFQEGEVPVIAEIFGCNIIVEHGLMDCVLRARF